MRVFVSKWIVGLMALAALLAAGCATYDNEESEIPWNAPQDWEGAPMIPGMD
jgi:hypothetical protein